MPSFDIAAAVDVQEVRNAVDQVKKEIAQRYDFKGGKSSVELKEPLIIIVGDDSLKMDAMKDMLLQRLSKRGLNLNSFEFGDIKPAGGDTLRQEVTIKLALSSEELKRINKFIKDKKLKVTSQIQGDELRVTGKKRDDLQEAIALVRAEMKDLSLQFTNFRD